MTENQHLDTETVAGHLQKFILDSEQTLDFLGRLAVHASGALSRNGALIHCGVTLLRERRAATAASSSPEAQRMDEVQYKYDEGPCLSAARDGVEFHAPDLAVETRWPEYLQEIQDAGIRSIMAVPMDLAGEALGALNFYAEAVHSFDDSTRAQALAYAAQAADSIRLAVRIAQQMDTLEDLKAAMASRTVIDVAVGVVMAQNRCSQNQAFAILQRASSTRNLKLRDVAAKVVGSIAAEDVVTHFDS
ncbi:GAF and ANTAR domain-containing protein [Arthrobacter sp. JSM 101049]|uniref:GAF and ANTAR domain-containing protein n=1 Tax=Arthrobacter sp. JSM 101049 TaxID=929097 RepID=UPI003563F726